MWPLIMTRRMADRLIGHAIRRYNDPVKAAALAVISSLWIGCSSRFTGAPVTDGMLLAVTNGYRCVARGGRVWCWGADNMGQAGGGAASSAGVPEPREVPNLAGVVELAASDEHACARLASGRVKCWGANGAGEVGSASAPAGTCTLVNFDAGPSDAPCQPSPTEVPGVEGAVQLSLGDARSCTRLSGGAIKCWGLSVRGAEWLPMQADVMDMALGNQDACVVASAGTIRCSGSTLETLAEWRGVARVAMSAKNMFSCVLRSGAVDCWGDNYAGQRGIGNTDANTASRRSSGGAGRRPGCGDRGVTRLRAHGRRWRSMLGRQHQRIHRAANQRHLELLLRPMPAYAARRGPRRADGQPGGRR
jgi:hypothetical protein